MVGRVGSTVRLAAVMTGLALSAGVAKATQPASEITSATYTHAHDLVAIDGRRRLNLFCEGQGKPVVIFDSGLGGSSMDWRRVQRAVADTSTACSYDRAGYGFSDPATRTSDASDAVDDLHRLIRAAKIPTPVILVGHSIAGLYATLFAARYRDEVAGLVLVDPASAELDQDLFRVVGTKARTTLVAGQKAGLTMMAGCVDAARTGELSKPTAASSECLDNPPNPDPILHQEINREFATVKTEEVTRSELENFAPGRGGQSVDDNEMAAAKPHLGSMPLIVLTAANHDFPPSFSPGEVDAENAALHQDRDHLAALSALGQDIDVPHSGHFIQLDQPGVVIRYVNQVVTDVRNDQRSIESARQTSRAK